MTPTEQAAAVHSEECRRVAADPDRRRMLDDALEGLTSPQKTLPPKYFYDEAGSKLFDEICALDEYYVTRTETSIMDASVGEMAEEIGPGALLVEFGSGSSVKTRVLLDALDAPVGYVPIDISADYLEGVADTLREEHPDVPVLPVAADFTKPFEVPVPPTEPTRTVVYFPGSTIGNFTRFQAQRLLTRMAAVAGPGGGVLIGADLVKPVEVLRAAYNDARGITARFNTNVLVRLNRELGADFDVDSFRHEAVFDTEEARIEMRLVSLREQRVHLAGHTIRFGAGEHILTEYSHKYTLASFAAVAGAAGLVSRRVWMDDDGLFSVHFLVPDEE